MLFERDRSGGGSERRSPGVSSWCSGSWRVASSDNCARDARRTAGRTRVEFLRAYL